MTVLVEEEVLSARFKQRLCFVCLNAEIKIKDLAHDTEMLDCL